MIQNNKRKIKWKNNIFYFCTVLYQLDLKILFITHSLNGFPSISISKWYGNGNSLYDDECIFNYTIFSHIE